MDEELVLYRFQFTFRYSVNFTFMRLLINSLWTVISRYILIIQFNSNEYFQIVDENFKQMKHQLCFFNIILKIRATGLEKPCYKIFANLIIVNR